MHMAQLFELRTRTLVMLGMAALMTSARVAASVPVWEKAAPATGLGAPETAVTDPANPESLFMISGRELMRGSLQGPWTHFPVPGLGMDRPHTLYTFPQKPGSLFLLTPHKALVLSLPRIRGLSFFEAETGEEVLCFSVLPEDPDHWLIGTTRGLFESDDTGKTWSRFQAFPERTPVRAMLFFKNHFFAATDSGLWKSRNLSSFEKILSLQKAWEAWQEQDSSLSEDHQSDPSPVTLTASEASDTLWAGTRQGVFESRDRGQSWTRLPVHGLHALQIEKLIYAPRTGKLSAATRDGIFLYDFTAALWKPLHAGLSGKNAKALFLLGEQAEKLGAITQDGLVSFPLNPEISFPGISLQPASDRLALLRRLMILEPAAREVHEEAIRYANVSNKKTHRWHRESRIKALIPDLSIGKSLSRHNSVDIDRGSTSEADRYILGPDSASRDLDVDVSWNLADLIWGTDQTSIDSREKLMVEMRQDLLSEATRIYYERRRLQLEIIMQPSAEENEHLTRLTRLDELTSLLDVMTGGAFGRSVSTVYEHHPEFEGLWAFPAMPGANSPGPQPLSKQN